MIASIGIEIHIQLATNSKLFCPCSTDIFGKEPNSLTCPVCLGLPGALPKLNRKAVLFAVRLAHAIGADIAPESLFERKNYFYPDLVKGYQITQQSRPLAEGGNIPVYRNDGSRFEVRIERLHLEEDSGRSTHPDHGEYSLIDFNRSGMPLVEMVCRPDIHSAADAAAYVSAVRKLVRMLEIGSGDMEKGALRCDVNTSIREHEDDPPGVRTEIKNLNSFQAIRKAVEYEIKRQSAQKEDERHPVTLNWNPETGKTEPMRSKESSPDYRYFPEPDLPPLGIDEEFIAEAVGEEPPELPWAKFQRYVEELGLDPSITFTLLAETERARWFEAVVEEGAPAVAAANWVNNEILGKLRERGHAFLPGGPFRASSLAELILGIEEKRFTRRNVENAITRALDEGRDPLVVAEMEELYIVEDLDRIQTTVFAVTRSFSDEVESYRNGKTQLIHFFVGQVMERLAGKGNPEEIRRLLEERLAGEE